MRIAMLSWESRHAIPVGGIAAHVTELSVALAVAGHEVHVFTRMGAAQEPYSFIDGVHIHRCPFDPHVEFMGYVDRMGESFYAALQHAERHDGRAFDVVHGHDWLAARALARVRDDLGRPTVMTLHSTEYGRCGNRLCDGASEQIRAREWEGLYKADRVLCVSGALADEARWLYGVPAEKLTVIYNGVDTRRFDVYVDRGEVRSRYAVGVDERVVLFVGRLAWQKGPDLLLDAAPEILSDHHEASFAIVGAGDMRPSLEENARRSGCGGSVRFLGERLGRELVDLFYASDLVCVPSRNEPFGIVVLEAWSASRPVVVTRSGGPAEFVRDGETGVTVEPVREAIARGVTSVLDDAVGAARIGRNGRQDAEARFAWDVIARQTIEGYRNL